jgi:hypothetical protein
MAELMKAFGDGEFRLISGILMSITHMLFYCLGFAF